MTPEIFYSRGAAQASLEEPQVHVYFDQIHAERRTGEVSAEVRFYGGANGSFGQVHRTRLNLTSARARLETANHLKARLNHVDWPIFLEDVCWQVVDAHRQGRKSISLRDAKAPAGGEALLAPLLLPRDPVILFGDGGSAKSYLALALVLSIEGGRPVVADLKPTAQLRTAYLDFEWHEWEHRKRAVALWGSQEIPNVEYVPCQAEGPLSQQVDRLRGIFQEKRIEYAVIDSVALACDGPPEEAQSALAFFQALARLEVGSLLLAHINRAGETDKPFGSAFWHNSARGTWYIQRAQEPGGTSLDVALHNRKVNAGAPAAPLGLHFDFGDRTTITRTDLRSVPELASGLPLRVRMRAELAAGALTCPELAQRLNEDVETIRTTAQRHKGKMFSILPGNPYRVGLLSSQTP